MQTLLIVDDEVLIAQGLHAMLAQAFAGRLQVLCCYSAAQALDIAEQTRVDILLTDINMPDISGLELHEKLIQTVAIDILEQLEKNGNVKYNDALKVLESDSKAMYRVALPNDFIGKDTKLLFPLINPMYHPQANVSGIFLRCVTEKIQRAASGIKKKKSEITTSEIIRRLMKK